MNCQTGGRQVAVDVGRLPVGHHRAELLDVVVEEPLLVGGKPGVGRFEQPSPVRPAGEELAVPPDGAGLDRLALGLRHRRHHLPEHREHRVAHELAPQRRHVARNRQHDEDEGQREGEPAGNRVRDPGDAERDGDRRGERHSRSIDVSQRQRADEHCNEPGQGEHWRLLPETRVVGTSLVAGVSARVAGRASARGRNRGGQAAAIADRPGGTGRDGRAAARRWRSRPA